MAAIVGSITIARPVEEVLDFVADERNEPVYNPQMRSVEKATPGPIGVGTLWRATVSSGRRTTPFELEVTQYSRPWSLGSVTRMATAEIIGGLSFSPDPAGTRLSWSWEVTPKGALRLAAPVFAVLGRRQEKRIWAGLKSHLESPEN
jgi:hypothetical protein